MNIWIAEERKPRRSEESRVVCENNVITIKQIFGWLFHGSLLLTIRHNIFVGSVSREGKQAVLDQ